MLYHTVFFTNEKLYRAEVFSGILTNLAKQKLQKFVLN